MKPLKNGVMLCLVLGLVSCRSSKPPIIEICILDGLGGANCIEHDGAKVRKLPSEMKNYWSTNEDDEAAFASWCYGSGLDATKHIMSQIRQDACE